MVQRFAACFETPGLPTGKYLQDEDSAKWMSENSLGKFKRRI